MSQEYHCRAESFWDNENVCFLRMNQIYSNRLQYSKESVRFRKQVESSVRSIIQTATAEASTPSYIWKHFLDWILSTVESKTTPSRLLSKQTISNKESQPSTANIHNAPLKITSTIMFCMQRQIGSFILQDTCIETCYGWNCCLPETAMGIYPWNPQIPQLFVTHSSCTHNGTLLWDAKNVLTCLHILLWVLCTAKSSTLGSWFTLLVGIMTSLLSLCPTNLSTSCQSNIPPWRQKFTSTLANLEITAKKIPNWHFSI